MSDENEDNVNELPDVVDTQSKVNKVREEENTFNSPKSENAEDSDDQYESQSPVYAPPYIKTGAPERDGACDAPMSRACGNYYWMRDSVVPDYNVSQFGSLIYHKPKPTHPSQNENYENVDLGDDPSNSDQPPQTSHPLIVKKANKVTKQQDKKMDRDWMPEFKIIDIVLTLIGSGFFLADIISDWRLAILYYLDDKITLFALTVAFIMIPAIISATISAIWSIIDHKRYTVHEQNRTIEGHAATKIHRPTTVVDKLLLLLNVVFAAAQLGRCFRSLVFVAYIIKSWRTEKKNHRKIRRFRKKALEQKQDSAILGLVDGFLESSLQFFLQLYLSITYDIKMEFLRILTICLSWISTAAIHTVYYKHNRKVQRKAQNVTKIGSLFYFLWRMCEIGPRFYIMVIFAYCFKYWSLLPLFLHFAFIVGFYIFQKPRLKGICCSEKSGYPFLFLVSYIGIFCYVNVKKGETKAYVLLYYFVFYLENIFMVVLVFMFFPSSEPRLLKWKYGVLIIVPGFILHIILQIVYYICFHPNKTIKDERTPKRKRCGVLSKYFKNLTMCGVKVF